MSQAEVGRMFGVTQGRVSQIIKAYNATAKKKIVFPPGRKKRKLPDAGDSRTA